MMQNITYKFFLYVIFIYETQTPAMEIDLIKGKVYIKSKTHTVNKDHASPWKI